MSKPNPYAQYLGDAVYVDFDGYHVVLRLNHHESQPLIYLEPPVLNALDNYRKWLAEKLTADRLAAQGEPDTSDVPETGEKWFREAKLRKPGEGD